MIEFAETWLRYPPKVAALRGVDLQVERGAVSGGQRRRLDVGLGRDVAGEAEQEKTEDGKQRTEPGTVPHCCGAWCLPPFLARHPSRNRGKKTQRSKETKERRIPSET